MRILTARSIVAARRLDRFPTRKRGEQFTQQRRLTDILSVTTNTDYQRSIHCHLPPSSAAATKVWRSHLQHAARVLVETVAHCFYFPALDRKSTRLNSS